jgi:hypothetical protein
MKPQAHWYLNHTKTQQRELQTNFPYEYWYKNTHGNSHKPNPRTHQNTHWDQLSFIPRMQGWFRIWKFINIIHYIKKIQRQKYIIISLEAEKAFDEIQHPFIVKVLERSVIQSPYLHTVKAVYSKPVANIKLNGEKDFHYLHLYY